MQQCNFSMFIHIILYPILQFSIIKDGILLPTWHFRISRVKVGCYDSKTSLARESSIVFLFYRISKVTVRLLEAAGSSFLFLLVCLKQKVVITMPSVGMMRGLISASFLLMGP
jgi:hypothetical protein